ncbi:hypothetical protein PV10_00168 [Exophiala mesophila]|uniref:C2 domain-containing protein n=1 Tax=Exophiala mesophila TaxID=212818 RepID=A0A0D1X393_EXOME|nr:uncharacterized protein PV10_00168 [Exophiala mesophila]KIV96285.1 hypothetical protein PV10_00168 [Exophiala mesophila]
MATRSRGPVNAAHTAGIFADSSFDGPEIGTLVAVVDRAKNLPNRKTMGKQDPYCAMRLGKEAKKTETDRRGGQTPRWDQELRFTVHESPDYFKLKCSIFNDDKKTDLIGEAWMDLHDVIVPGGGKNDLWHQLNFKGKYAGDIRVELTYYDTRPRPETPSTSEKKRQRLREKSLQSTGDTGLNNAPGARQLGPREITRRPLPPGPGGASSPVNLPHTPEQQPSPIQTDYPPDVWVPERSNNTNAMLHPRKHAVMPETPDDIGFDMPNQYPPQPYDQSPSHQYDPSVDTRPSHHSHQKRNSQQQYSPYSESNVQASPRRDDFRRSQGYGPDRYGNYDAYAAEQSDPLPHDHSSRNSIGRPPSNFDSTTPPQSPQAPINTSPYHSSPPHRTSPQPPALTNAQSQSWQRRGSASPTKHAPYRDSPLRQSISQYEVPHQRHDQVAAESGEDEAPPPPPAHGGQMVRIPDGFSSPQRPSPNYAPHTPTKRGSVEDRSPLQRLEHHPYPDQGLDDQTQDRRQSPMQPLFLTSSNDYEPYRPDVVQDAYHQRPIQHTLSNNMTYDGPEPSYHRPTSRQSPSEPRGLPRPADYGQYSPYSPSRSRTTLDGNESADENRVHRSDPVIVRPRAISPNTGYHIPRKSITPTPSTPEIHSLGSTPYGPDSYDVLNPVTSPMYEDDPFATPEQRQELARQREVEKLRDQGPIIGNDGRVIDPSDHLPSDTWAPEPERKNRKPEHVIKIRTREEARMHQRTGSSPSSVQPLSISTSPSQASPQNPFTSQPQIGPTPPAKVPLSPQGDSPSGRNRLKKSQPARPLPVQPYPQAQTSPAVMTVSAKSATPNRPSPTTHAYTVGSSPSAGQMPRPSSRDYQIPTVDHRASRELRSRPAYSSSPTKPSYPPAPYATDYDKYGEDSLALELSTIDIGPSRGGRTALRPHRGYPGY